MRIKWYYSSPLAPLQTRRKSRACREVRLGSTWYSLQFGAWKHCCRNAAADVKRFYFDRSDSSQLSRCIWRKNCIAFTSTVKIIEGHFGFDFKTPNSFWTGNTSTFVENLNRRVACNFKLWPTWPLTVRTYHLCRLISRIPRLKCSQITSRDKFLWAFTWLP